ncbi:hypothetical protein [Pseudomonas sp. NPDC089406]|uniref:hypothetical protein n=1 Tax=Pseudomonas sp. NPDC089406 TaxID=3364463 RepID=UPI00384DEBE5
MKTFANLTLYAPGIVLFDPQTLLAFLQRLGIEPSNVFELFINDQAIGNQAIRQGVIFPLYEIAEDDYAVFCEAGQTVPKGACPHFTYTGAPLHITSGVLITADLGALMEWDPQYFGNYLANYEDRLNNNNYLEVPTGKYLVSISGYSGLEAPLHPRGYGLRFNSVQQLPDTLPDEDFDFALKGAMQ